MARVLEDHGKRLLSSAGLTVPNSTVITTPVEALDAYDRIAGARGAILKALVPVRGRGKQGAVLSVASATEAERASGELLGTKLHGWTIDRLLLEEAMGDGQELYVAVTIDEDQKKLVALISDRGGVNIDENAESLRRVAIDPCYGLPAWRARSLWKELGMPGKVLHELGNALRNLYQLATEIDAILLEVNPLLLTKDGRVVALDSVIVVDEFALSRQPELSNLVLRGYGRPLTKRERTAQEADERDPYQGTARYFETCERGLIGFLCGGGGGSLTMYDALLRYGGEPANYAEVGGNPPARKVEGLTRVVLSKPGVKGLLVCCNTTNNTQVDQVAEGVVAALRCSGKELSEFPVIFRFPGINQERAKQILAEAGIEFHGREMTMEEAARRAVELIREAT